MMPIDFNMHPDVGPPHYFGPYKLRVSTMGNDTAFPLILFLQSSAWDVLELAISFPSPSALHVFFGDTRIQFSV